MLSAVVLESRGTAREEMWQLSMVLYALSSNKSSVLEGKTRLQDIPHFQACCVPIRHSGTYKLSSNIKYKTHN
jgi:hypothetical protein